MSVTDGLLNTANGRFVCLLIVLGLSAAFHSVDHKILLDRFSLSSGIHGTDFKWFTSYLPNRTQSIVLNDVASSLLPLLYGVPQGSVLGPILFALYTQQLVDI